MKAKQFLTAAAAMFAIGAPQAQEVKAQNGITITQQKEGIVTPIKSAKQIIKEDAGGLQVMGYREGIPPHIYGKFHVKDRSHKRTNNF